MSEQQSPAARPGQAAASARELSPSQERLLCHDRLHEGSPLYSVPVRYRFRGALDAGALHGALQDLVARHEALRAYVTASGRFVTQPAASLPWSVLDLSAEEPAVAAALARQYVTAQARRPISTAAAPLARACLVSEPGDRSTLLLTLHHLIADQHSLDLLDQQLQELYGSRVGLAAAVPSPRRCATGQPDRQMSLNYWRGQLAGLGPRMPVPADRRPDVVGPHGDVVSAPMGEALTASLAGLAADCSATVFMVLLAGYAAFLGRVVAPEVVIGVPMYGRTSRDEHTIGMFVNIAPIRVRAGDDVTYRNLIGELRGLVTVALAHQHVPLQDLVAEAPPAGGGGSHPLTQVGFSYVDDRRWYWAPAGVTAVRDVLPTGTAKWELMWTVTADRTSSRSALEFSTDLFSRGRAEELHSRLLETLTALSAAPDLPLGEALRSSGPRGERSELRGRLAAEGRKGPPGQAKLTAGSVAGGGSGGLVSTPRENTVSTPREITAGLADIWRDVLGTGDPSPDSDFFSHGGTSIKALRLVGAVHERFGVELRIVTVFRRPAFGQLVHQITELMRASGEAQSE
ncbi:MAG: hypothetical protein JO345_17830 [Streptosporangiaceae bacterium]|nr:hypothetical protein [Streptosporangiaceae bacterium]